MSSPLPSTAEEWRTRAREFSLRVVVPVAERIDRDDRMPEGIRAALAQEGFLGLGLSPEYGGSGGDANATVAVLEELAAGSAAVAILVAVHLSVAAAPIARWGTPAQKERFLRPLASGKLLGAFGLTEPSVGSDAAHLACRYRSVPGGYLLDGTKMFITNAASADLVLVFATRDPSMGSRGIAAFIVPTGTAGYSIAQRFDKLGIRGSETNELVLQSVHLDGGLLLGVEGEGLRVALDALTGGRVGIAACGLGVARAAFEEMQQSARGDPSDWKRATVAEAFTDLAAARALVQYAAGRQAAGEPFVEEASAAKLFTSRVAVSIAARGLDVAGAAGARSGARAERLLRDARVFPIVEGTTEIQQLILGRALVGR